jgi:hypothetical protein
MLAGSRGSPPGAGDGARRGGGRRLTLCLERAEGMERQDA